MGTSFMLLFLALSLPPAIIGDVSECITPNNVTGICIGVHQCQPILNIIYDLRKPYPNETLTFLRSSWCGAQTGGVKVCCPSSNSNGTNGNNTNLLPSMCGLQNEERIYIEPNTQIDTFFWLALLNYTKPSGYGFHCGGVLISDRYVLTAAHCVPGNDIPKDWKLSEVRIGEHDTSKELDCLYAFDYCNPAPVNVRIEKIIVHEKYQSSDKIRLNDIALLRLAEPVDFADYLLPICVPLRDETVTEINKTQYAAVSGWGKARTINNDFNPALKMQTSLRIMNQSSCTSFYRGYGVNIENSHICTDNSGDKNACYGDSGGPLMAFIKDSYQVIGINSFGPSPCTSGFPQVYTRVTDYGSWILNNLEP